MFSYWVLPMQQACQGAGVRCKVRIGNHLENLIEPSPVHLETANRTMHATLDAKCREGLPTKLRGLGTNNRPREHSYYLDEQGYWDLAPPAYLDLE